MTKTVDLISPIDGSVYLTREVLTQEAAFDAAKRAKAAQADWAARPVSERIAMVRKAAEIIGGQQDRMTQEIAHQMGRPIRYGGEFGGFNERLSYMADVADESLAPMEIEDSDTFRRVIKRVPWGTVMVIAPWNYPYMTAINTVAPATLHDPIATSVSYIDLLTQIDGLTAVYGGGGETGNGDSGAAASGSRDILAGTNVIDNVGHDFGGNANGRSCGARAVGKFI